MGHSEDLLCGTSAPQMLMDMNSIFNSVFGHLRPTGQGETHVFGAGSPRPAA